MTEQQANWQIGQRVQLLGKQAYGSIAFVGPTQFANGIWVGVALDEQKGRNNGSVLGISYFKCATNCGIFVRATQLIALTTTTTSTTTTSVMSKTPIRTTTTKIARPQMSSCCSSSQLSLNVQHAVTLQRSKTSVSAYDAYVMHKQKKSEFVETGFLEILQPNFTPGIAKIKKPQSQQTNIVKQQQTMEMENAQLKLQNQQLLEFKCKILEQQQLMQRDMQHMQQQLRDANEEKTMLQRQNADLQYNLELISLDKEVAEERVETMQLELEILQEKFDELNLQLTMHKKPINLHLTNNDNMEMQQLQQRNQRLTETVLRLRDAFTQEKLQLQQVQQQFDANKSLVNELQLNKQMQAQRIGYMEQQMLELKEQVDAALGAEQMVLHLSSAKFELEDRIKLLEEEINELESLEQIHEQLLESSQELEQELREDVMQLQKQLRQWQQQHNDNLQNLQERDLSISKFRQLVANLQQQQQQQQQQQNTFDEFTCSNSSLNDSDCSLANYNQLFNLFKTKERELDIKLQQIVNKSLQLHIKWLLAFMPDDLLLRAGIHDIILCLVALQRFYDKLILISQLIIEKFPTACDMDKQTFCERYSMQRCLFRCQALYLMRCMQLVVQQLLNALQGPDYDLCKQAAIYRHNIELQEQPINDWLQLLKQDMLDENSCMESMEIALNFLNNLLLNLLYTAASANAEAVIYASICNILLQAYDIYVDGLNAAISLLQSLMQTEQLLDAVQQHMEDWRNQLRRLQHKLPQCVAYKYTRNDVLQMQRCHIMLGQALKLLINASKQAARQLFSQQPMELELELSMSAAQMWQLLEQQQFVLHGSEQSASNLLQQLPNLLNMQLQHLNECLKHDTNSANNFMLHATENALLQYALQLKANMEDKQLLKQHIEQRDQEIRTLKYVAKMKQQDYSELQIRKDMSERKLQLLHKQQLEFCQQLNFNVNALMQQQEQQLLHMNNGMEGLYARLHALQDTWKCWQLQHLKYNHLHHMSANGAWQELQTLGLCLRQERLAYARAAGEDLKVAFRKLAPLHVPQMQTLRCARHTELSRRCRVLQRQWLLAQMSLKQRKSEDGWKQRKLLEHNCAILINELLNYYFTLHPHRQAAIQFGQFATLDCAKQLNQALNRTYKLQQ